MAKTSIGMDYFVCIFWVIAVYSSKTLGITTIHHDKPEDSGISKMATKMNDHPDLIINDTLTPFERQKRLLSYENFYLTQADDQRLLEPINQNPRYQISYPPLPKKVYPQYNIVGYHQIPSSNQPKNNKFTPFLESNAIPGPFRPIIPNRQPQRVKVHYIALPQPPPAKVLDYSEIYDKLSQLKLQQNSRRPTYYAGEPQRYIAKPQVAYIPQTNTYKTIQPSKTTIETFTVANIDIPSDQEQYNSPKVHEIQVMPAKAYENDVSFFQTFQESPKPVVDQQITVEIPHSNYPQQIYDTLVIQKPYQGLKQTNKRPYILVQVKPEEQSGGLHPISVQKPLIVLQKTPMHKNKPVPLPPSGEKFAPVTFIPPSSKYEDLTGYEHQSDRPPAAAPELPVQPFTEPTPVQTFTELPSHISTQNSNELVQILKQLQATNALPKTLTTDNIDNSIKTLVKILEALKKQQKLAKPIVVQDDISPGPNAEIDNEADIGISSHTEDVSGIISHQTFPGEAPDGGTPGKPGVDYPALSSIPQTSFNCKTQRYKGFFGDPDTNCQVWHYCDLNGGQASFLCPNGTIFSQVALTCDWWYNVKCSSTAQLYVLNERLYKYIIPLSPKFPEDYSGPLVDKYLALKFQEMEEKMRKEKKGKGNVDKEKENEELQEIETESPDKTVGRPKAATSSQLKETLETIEDDNDSK